MIYTGKRTGPPVPVSFRDAKLIGVHQWGGLVEEEGQGPSREVETGCGVRMWGMARMVDI